MDSGNTTIIENVQISLPFSIIKTLINEINLKTQCFSEWKVTPRHLPENEMLDSVKLSINIDHGEAIFKFDRLPLYAFDNHHSCHLHQCNLVDSQIDDKYSTVTKFIDGEKAEHAPQSATADQGTQTDGVVADNSSESFRRSPDLKQAESLPSKRKRGRPRLNKTTSINNDVGKQPDRQLSNSDKGYSSCSGIEPNQEPDDTLEPKNVVCKIEQMERCSPENEAPSETPARRYGLRGVKLNTHLMNAVKGLDSFSIEGDGKMTVEQHEKLEDTEDGTSEVNCEIDPDFVEKSGDSDSDFATSNAKKVKSEPFTEKRIQSISNNIPSRIVDERVKRKKRKDRIVACKICNKLLCDYAGVYKHVLRKHSRHKIINQYLEELTKLKAVRCEICHMEIPDSFRLKIHMETKHGNVTPAQCYHCGKSFKNSLSLKSHVHAMHIQSQGKCNLCHLCSAAFKTLSNLNQHINLVHVKKHDFVCKICNKRFGNKPQLTRHSRSHGLDESKRVHCSFCDKSFLFEFNLRRHINGVHSQRSEKFHCSYCAKGFQNKAGMITHVQGVHFNLLPYSCTECSVSFPLSSLLKTHMVSHHGKLDYKLPELLSKNGIYDRTTENMFYCSYCSSGFTHKAKLVEHMHSDHASAFPHMCTICNQGFLEKAFLDIHNLRVHNIVDLEEGENGQIAEGCGSGEILQFITTKEGCPSKIVAIQSEQVSNPTAQGEIDSVTSQTLENGTLLVEVANGSTTTQYMVQAPEGMVNSNTVVQDISNILLAAGKTLQTEMNSSGVQEISLVLESPGDDEAELMGFNTDTVNTYTVAGETVDTVNLGQTHMVDRELVTITEGHIDEVGEAQVVEVIRTDYDNDSAVAFAEQHVSQVDINNVVKGISGGQVEDEKNC